MVVVQVAILAVVSSVASGFVLHVMWGWFLVPTLGLPYLSMTQSVGISMLVSHLTFGSFGCTIEDNNRKKDPMKDLLEKGYTSIFRSGMCLCVGWVAHLFL